MALSDDDDTILELDTNPNELDFLESKDLNKFDHLNEKGKRCDINTKEKSEKEEEICFGPILPPNLKKTESDFHGPALPPHFKKKSNFIGPQIPNEFMIGSQIQNDTKIGPQIQNDVLIGPQIPSHIIKDSEIIGPLPGLQENDDADYTQKQIEERAQQMKERLSNPNKNEIQKRETWMLELPPDRANEFGLGPRQFRRREKDPTGDRSVWTATPQDKQQEKDHPSTSISREQEMEMKFIKERDEAMQKVADSHSDKKSKKSLLEKHQKKLKKKMKKESSKPKERRPFSREVDLQTNRFDEAQKNSIIKKAQNLNDRFSQGKSKFL